MLAAIISLLQADVQPQPRPPMIKIDRGGGGAVWPRFEIVDYYQASSTFREMPDEHPVDRAARRVAHIGRELKRIQDEREAREKAMAVGVLWGAALERSAAQERATATASELAAVARRPVPTELVRRADRGYSESGGGAAIAVALLGVGAIAAIAYAKSRRRR